MVCQTIWKKIFKNFNGGEIAGVASYCAVNKLKLIENFLLPS